MEFLRSVAKAYVPCLCSEEQLDNHTFILPNRRSLKFFQKYLGEEYYREYNKPLLSPKLVTINDFIVGLGNLAQVDPVTSLYTLYENYVKLKQQNIVENEGIANKEIESFDDFVYWGDMILKDFDDIDKYMVNASQLFTNIKDLKDLSDDYSYLTPAQRKAIESFWGSFFMDPFTDKKQAFFSLWHIMLGLYENFRAELAQKGLGYQGQIYRMAAESIEKCDVSGVHVFVGLNAPNKCERKIMNYLKDAGKADFYWDFYGKLLTDAENSAGRIIRECVSDYPSKLALPDVEKECGIPSVTVFGVPSGVGQAFKVAEILNGINNDENIIKTCVQLPDERLLLPVLNSVPEKFTKINVTMGYPISQTAFISFMNLIAELQRGVRKYGGRTCFYYKNLNDILDHSFISGYDNETVGKEAVAIKSRMLEKNLVFVPVDSDFILNLQSPLLRAVFRTPQTSGEVADYQTEILKEIESSRDSLTKEFVYQYYLRIKALSSLDIQMEVKTYFRLLSRLTSSITVPFRGEPLEGLQLMGSLETRAIDFDNLIIVSANEGMFPSGSVNNSLIPYNLRLGFDLPTYELQDSIAAYHFYRSISRVKNLYMIYDTRSDGLSTGEVSRFVKQLKYHFLVDVKESIVSYKIPMEEDSGEICIEKDQKVMELLKNKKTYSISAINNYFICPLKFYLSDVLKIRDEDEISEELEASTFGSIYHKVMQNLYEPYVGKMVTSGILESISADHALIARNIKSAFKEISNIVEIKGRREIEFALIENYVQHTILRDISRAPFKYIAGEQTLTRKLLVYPGGEYDKPAVNVTFRGDIDRQEEIDGKLYIIDYKTGIVDESKAMETDMSKLFDVLSGDKYHIARQLFMYAFLNRIKKDTSLMIYGLRTIASEKILEVNATPSDVSEFEDYLSSLMEEIFNPNIPFRNLPGCEGCKWCDFSSLCNK